MEFKGIFAANVTPFDPDGRAIRTNELGELLADLKRAGIAGMVCNAHAGEGELLSREEKVEVLRLARQVLGPNYPIFRLVYRDPYVYLHIRYKYCAWLLDKISSPAVRSPLVPLPEEEVDALREGLLASGIKPLR